MMQDDQEKTRETEWELPFPLPVLIAIGVATVAISAFLVGAFAYRTWDSVRGGDSAGAKAAQAKPKKKKKVGPGGRYPVQFSTQSLFPAFSPDQRRYVTRCTPAKVTVRVNARPGTKVRIEGSPAATGRFTTEARPVPGQDFGIDISGAGPRFDGEYRVRCLPVGFPNWGYQRFRKPPKGNFVVAFRGRPYETTRSWIIAFNQDGLPIWWFSPNINALWGQILPNGQLHWARGFGDGFGQDQRGAHEVATLEGETIRTVKPVGTPNDAHEVFFKKNGNAMVMSYTTRYGEDLSKYALGSSTGVIDGEIQEVDPQGNVVWRWNSADHIGMDETPVRWWDQIDGWSRDDRTDIDWNSARWWDQLEERKHADLRGRVRYDIFHLNSIQQVGNDQVLISSRHTDAVYMISRRTGEVLWKLGGVKTKRSLKVVGPDPYRDDPLNGNHDARMIGNELYVHDNGTLASRPPRLVRYKIDPEKKTATFIAQYSDPKVAKYSMCCGGARKFGNGWIVSWGNRKVVSAFDGAGKLAFRLKLPSSSYRVVPVPSSVSPARLEQALEASEGDFGPPSRAIRAIEFQSRDRG